VKALPSDDRELLKVIVSRHSHLKLLSAQAKIEKRPRASSLSPHDIHSSLLFLIPDEPDAG
jgi:hypothetical protein